MSFTCYSSLRACDLGQIDPPYFTANVTYTIINTTGNVVVNAATTGSNTGQVFVNLTPPIASQQAVLAALVQAVQAAEPSTPGLNFIWLGL